MTSTLPKIKIAGVPEHFNIPWHIAIEDGTFKKHGVDVCQKFLEMLLRLLIFIV
jgi:ABC-type nitrate/sulfonate/bicarbonate transport system substrate-binding protein